MRQRPAIQKFIAVFLLLIFLISAAPKSYFHSLLAGHKDVSYCSEVHRASACLHQQGIQCHFDDLVVSSAFIMQPQALAGMPVLIGSSSYDAAIFTFHTEAHTTREVRGPPAVG